MLKKTIIVSYISTFFLSCTNNSGDQFIAKPEKESDRLFVASTLSSVPEAVDSNKAIVSEQIQQTKGVNEIKIGKQVWMAENLDVDRFKNGDPIHQAASPEEWARATENKQAAWCYYKNTNIFNYGKLYNWYAVIDPRGLAPDGWHIPDTQEWTKLSDFLGGEKAAGIKMKSNSDWRDNSHGNNESGFNGLPGGFCTDDGFFSSFGFHGRWWSSTENELSYAWMCTLSNLDNNFHLASGSKEYGISVRCIKN